MKLWIWWIAVVFVASGPWYGIVKRPQWDRVTWIPFPGFEDKPRDVAVNVLLWMPFGWSFAAGRPGSKRIAQALAVAAAVSLTAETSQLFARLRDPSATDVTMALVGTAAGATLARLWTYASG